MYKQNRFTSIMDSKLYPLLLFIVSFVFVTLFSRSTSFLYVFEGADPSIFKQMGRAILKGKTIYIDYFDNKGCLLYFIHALGLWLGGNIFLLLMQVCSLTITLYTWDKILALYQNQSQRIICLGIILLLLLCFYGAGDQTQEWCLLFISYPLLVYFKSYKSNKEILPIQWILIGLCFGVITFIQVNNACAFLGFVAYLWILYFQKKDFRKLFLSIGCFVAGWLIIALPCVLYFYTVAGKQGIYEMVYASFLSNFEYMGIQKYRSWIYWLPYSLFLISFFALSILCFRKKKDILIPLLISFFLFLLTFGKLCNSFYLMAILPLCVVGMAFFSIEKRKRLKSSLLGLAFVSAIVSGSMVFFHFVNDLVLQHEKEVIIYRDFHRCIENIPESERDSIFNYNLFWHGYGMMQHENLLQCNRVSIAYDLPTLMKEESSRPFVSPKWIMLSFNMKYYQEDAYFILNNYELVETFHYDRLYFQKPKIGNDLEISIFRRKY